MIEILWEASLPPIYSRKDVEIFSEKASKLCGLEENQEISLVFTTNEQISRLNEAYRNKPEPTDVLSFAFEEVENWPEKYGAVGEVFISTQMLAENAVYFNVDEEEELKRLIVHGFLHVLGHDHTTNNKDEPMLIKQEEILSRLSYLSLKKS